jgi:hypothetical protein
MKEGILIHDLELKDAVVKRLKQVHNIVDPWDLDPQSFSARWAAIHAARPKRDPIEFDRLRNEYLQAALEEERRRQRKPEHD